LVAHTLWTSAAPAMTYPLYASKWFLPRHTPGKAFGRWRPRALVIPGEIRKIFAVSVIAVTSAYALGPMMLSLGAQTAHDLIGSDNALVNGAAITTLSLAAVVLAAFVGKEVKG
jgi:hypothetical protein